MEHHALDRGHTVGRQFHQVHFAFAFEQGGLHDPGGDQGDHDPDDVNDPHGERLIFFREERRDQQSIDRQTGSAAHQRQHHDRNRAVPFGFDGTGRHHSGNRTAEAQHQRHKGASLQPEFAHNPIHHKGSTGHVAGIFQNGNGKKEQQDVRQEHDHAANTADDTIHDQAVEESFRKNPANKFAQPAEEVFDPLHGRFRNGKGKPERCIHDRQKDGEAEELVGQHGIDLIRDLSAAFLRNGDGIAAGTGEHGIATVRHEGIRFDRMLIQQMLDLLFHLIMNTLELIQPPDTGIVFQQFNGKETGGDVLILFDLQVVDLIGDSLDRIIHIRAVSQHGNAVIFQFGESSRQFLQKRLHTVAAVADCLHNGRTKIFFQFWNIVLQTFFLGIIRHIEGQQHGDMQFRQLSGQVQTALGDRGVDHVDDQVDAGLCQFLKDHFLFRRGGGKRVHARQVDQFNVHAVQLERTALAFHSHAGIVAHVLSGTGKSIEDTGLPAVRIPCESDPE